MLKELDRQRIPRRDFLAYLGTLGVGAGVSQALRGTIGFQTARGIVESPLAKSVMGNAAKWAKAVPSPVSEPKRVYPFEGGFIETSFTEKPPFIDPQEGHAQYLRFICLNHPVVKETFIQSYEDLSANPGQRLGTMLKKNRQFAEASLKKYMGIVSPEEAVHTAVYAMAGVLSPYFTFNDINSLGIKTDLPQPIGARIFTARRFSLRLPRIYPLDESMCNSELDILVRCIGIDRAVHFAQNLFLTYQYIYLLKHGLADAKRIPNGVRALVEFFGFDIPMKADILDTSAQFYWEGKETVEKANGLVGKDENGQEFASGFMDKYFLWDFAANNLGKENGKRLMQPTKNIAEFNVLFEKVVTALNDDEIYKVSFKKRPEETKAALQKLPVRRLPLAV